MFFKKAMGRTPGGSASNGFQALEESKMKRIEAEIKILKKERDEFFSSRFDKVIRFYYSSLSEQRLFFKIYF